MSAFPNPGERLSPYEPVVSATIRMQNQAALENNSTSHQASPVPLAMSQGINRTGNPTINDGNGQMIEPGLQSEIDFSKLEYNGEPKGVIIGDDELEVVECSNVDLSTTIGPKGAWVKFGNQIGVIQSVERKDAYDPAKGANISTYYYTVKTILGVVVVKGVAQDPDVDYHFKPASNPSLFAFYDSTTGSYGTRKK